MPVGEKRCVCVTGFGPFKGHLVNASWVAVQELAKLGLSDDVELIIYELPVVYEDVKKIIPGLWEKHKPVLMVHVGVSGIADEITLEQQAHNDGYNRCDVRGVTPITQTCVDGSCHDVIVSKINMAQVCKAVNEANLKVTTVVSHDPGRYLCDFSYYISLHQNRDCSAFIHVPPLGSPYSGAELALGLQASIRAMLTQVQ
ncbi:pyroglutamyl-peptidase 1 [Aplysia californica]|uniref:Pyroglutamyl-peptidase 1 n=1 Tax=Aplysia californica TaxID=6500 RepID=A0ABM1A8N9_APLCA|nr:pyroglutamyl-peptidase 1 [Aplysia californica]XP_005107405.1 pyroglutamyl-peptidase 1 [Aplysia californica]XP_012942954.1 pyroglutamyl-peptidase 1 [Aplysia californica]XP_035828050.1 pyroglutamyl-peptidase 1 [Aplysia californica]